MSYFYYTFRSLLLHPLRRIETDSSLPHQDNTWTREAPWQIPSGQQIARAMGAPILSAADLQELAQFDNSLLASTPLFYYLLKEAQLIESGEHLGPVGGRIVGEVFVNNLRNDPNSYFNVDPGWVPGAGGGSSFRMTHFLTYARVDPASRGQ